MMGPADRRAYSRLAVLAAALVAALGAVALAGWLTGNPGLHRLGQAADIKANAALAFLLSGVGLWLLAANSLKTMRVAAGLACAAAVALIGSLSLLQDLAQVNLGIDSLIAAEPPGAAATGARGRMAPQSGLAFALAGLAMALLPTRSHRAASTLQGLGTIVLAIGLVVLTGYLYGATALPRLDFDFTAMAPHTALGFVVLGAGVLVAAPDRGWVRVFTGATLGSMVARRLLPALGLVVIVLGWLRLLGEGFAWYDTPLGTALFAVAAILILGGLIWRTASTLHRSDLERRAAEHRVWEQRQWLVTTLLSIGDGVITTDQRGRVVLMNGVAEALTGYITAEAAGRPLLDIFRIVNEQTGEPVEDPVARVLLDGRMVALANHTALINKDGRRTPIQDSAAPIRSEDGRLIGVVLVFRDVARERRAQDALRTSEATKAAIIGNSLDAIITMDESGRILEFNPAAERMFEYRREEVIGQPLADLLIPESHRAAHTAGVERFLQTGKGAVIGRHVEMPALRADGSEFMVELAIVPIPTGGRPMFAGHLRDITERKRIELALQQRAAQQRSVALIGEMALRERDLQEVMQRATAMLADTLGVDYCKVLEVLPDGRSAVLRAGFGWREGLIGAGTVPLHINSQAGYALSQNEPVLVEDLRTETRFAGPSLLHEHGVVSGMSCIIAGPEGDPWGVLGAHTTSRRAFTNDDVHFLVAVANVLANAIKRDHSEQALRRREQLYRAIGESINYGVWVAGPDGKNIYVSASFLNLVGLTQEQCAEFGWGGVLHPDDAEATMEAWKQTVRAGGFWEREHRVRGVDGRWHHVLARGVPIRDDAGNIVYWAGINLDIDELKRTNQALRESEERFREIAETIGEVFYVTDHKTMQYISPAFEAVWGRSRESLLSGAGSFLDSVVEEDRPAVEEAMSRQAQGEATETEYRIRRDGGEIRWIHDRAFPVQAEDGRVLRTVGVADDVTERRQHEEQMRSVMGELNHRVKNTLAVIQSIALQTARRAPDLEHFQKSFRERLMSMASAHSLLTQTQWEGASLRDIINSELQPRVASPVQFRVSGPFLRLRPKAALALHMVIHELATNAAKYGAIASEKGHIDVEWTVQAKGEQREVRLTWIEQTRAPIAEPADVGYGTKLIDQLIRYELQGNVARQFRPEGLHCQIEFDLTPRDVVDAPAAAPKDGLARRVVSGNGAPTAQSANRSPGDDCRVLVVEDNSTLAMTLCDELEEAGFTVVGPVGTLARGLDLSDRESVDAAVLDVDLDGTRVYPLARRLRDRSVPFILVTGYEAADLPVDLREAPMLRKPARVDRIRSFLEGHLDRQK